MKCDVCLTKIPLGEDTCPNCGYVMRKEHAFAYDSSGQTHEHIQVPKKVNYKPLNRKKRQQNVKSKGLYIAILVIVLSIIISVGFSLFWIIDEYDSSYETSIFEDMTLTEIIEEGYDENGILDEAQNQSILMQTFLIEHDFTDVNAYDHSYQFDDEIMSRITVDAKKNEVDYSLSMRFSSQRGLLDTEINISYRSKDNMRDQMLLPQEEVELIAEYLEMSNAYTIFDGGRSLMKVDEDNSNRYVYSYYEDYSLYMSEEYTKSRQEYYHYWTLRLPKE